MGTWGRIAFDNDTARDFLETIAKLPSRAVTRAVNHLLRTVEFSNEAAEQALAAIELIALRHEAPKRVRFVPEVQACTARLAGDLDVVQLALDCLARIADPRHCSLAEAWSESPSGRRQFRNAIKSTQLRLLKISGAVAPAAAAALATGDIVAVPVARRGVCAFMQIASGHEVILFDGVFRKSAQPVAAIINRQARRLLCDVASLRGVVQRVGRAAIRPTLRAPGRYSSFVQHSMEWLWASSGERLYHGDQYIISSSRGPVVATFEQARHFPKKHSYTIDELCAIAEGRSQVVQVVSPSEVARKRRESDRAAKAATTQRHRGLRKTTRPGPFGDPTYIELLWFNITPTTNPPLHNEPTTTVATELLHALETFEATVARPSDFQNEYNERSQYLLVGVVAVWLGRWPLSQWPVPLRSKFPPVPDKRSLRRWAKAARIVVKRLGKPNGSLSEIWSGAADKGAGLRASIRRLAVALEG